MFQPFLCSAMNTLPQGLLEIPSFNCSLNFAEKVMCIIISKEVIAYAPSMHVASIIHVHTYMDMLIGQE